MEDPGSLGAREQLRQWGLTRRSACRSDAGLRVDALRRTDAGTVLVSPAHQFPMGVVLVGTRRRDLVAGPGRRPVIEDDYDAEHRYDRPPVTALRAAQPDRVCYTGRDHLVEQPRGRQQPADPQRRRQSLGHAARVADRSGRAARAAR